MNASANTLASNFSTTIDAVTGFRTSVLTNVVTVTNIEGASVTNASTSDAVELAVVVTTNGVGLVTDELVTITNVATGPCTDINNTNATLAPVTSLDVAVTTQGRNAASSSTGLMYRDASNNNEVRLLGASPNVGYVLTTTAANVIAWASPSGSNNTAFMANKTALSQTIANDDLLTTYTTITWNEVIDEGTAFATNVYTVPSTGIYHFGVDLEWSTTTKTNKGERVCRIRNTTSPATLLEVREQVNSDNSIAFWQRLLTIALVSSSQVVAVQVTQNSKSNQTVGVNSQFFGYMIEP